MKPLDQIFPLEILTQLASQHQIHPGLLWDQLQAAADAFQAATVGKDKNMVSMMREMEMLAERISAFAAEIENPRVQSWLAAEAVEMLRQQRGPSMGGPGGEDASAREALNEAGHLVQNDVACLRRLAESGHGGEQAGPGARQAGVGQASGGVQHPRPILDS